MVSLLKLCLVLMMSCWQSNPFISSFSSQHAKIDSIKDMSCVGRDACRKSQFGNVSGNSCIGDLSCQGPKSQRWHSPALAIALVRNSRPVVLYPIAATSHGFASPVTITGTCKILAEVLWNYLSRHLAAGVRVTTTGLPLS